MRRAEPSADFKSATFASLRSTRLRSNPGLKLKSGFSAASASSGESNNPNQSQRVCARKHRTALPHAAPLRRAAAMRRGQESGGTDDPPFMKDANVIFNLRGQGVSFGLLPRVGNKLVIPISMTRPTVARKALGVLPILAALRTDAAGFERVPDAATGRLAHPMIGWMRNPLALRTKYFHFSHTHGLSCDKMSTE